MKQALLLFEWHRPRYLRICLDSIAACQNREQWPVIVAIDGDTTPFAEFVGRCSELVGWPHAGNLWHVTRSLRHVFDQGYERVLFLDGDMILRPDALQQPYQKEASDELFVCLAGHSPPRQPWFAPQGLVLYRQDAYPLLDYVDGRGWVGSFRPGHTIEMKADYPHYDAVYCRYMLDQGMVSRYSEKSYAGHIGLCGEDCRQLDLEAELFRGPPEMWLRNAVRLFSPERSPIFVPKGFRYE